MPGYAMALLQFPRPHHDPTPPAASPADDLPPPLDPRRPMRIGLVALVLAFAGFLAWASLAPLDEGVAAPGAVSIDSRRKTLQHFTGGIVRELLVREGDLVREGQPLLRLDDGRAKAAFEAARQRYLGLRATQSRLQAEQVGSGGVAWHPDLLVADEPQAREHVGNQQQLLQSRRAALAADLRAIEESIQGQEGLARAYQQMLESRRTQLRLLQEEWKNTRELVQDGYAPRNRQLELERMVADSMAAQAELLGNLVRAQRSVAEQRQRAIARQQEYRKEVEQQLADVSREVVSEAERLRAARDELARIELRAPASGQVLGLTVHTVGGVVQPGQRLLDIVPEREPLLLDARIAPQFVDRVRAGLPVDVRFAAFAHAPQLVVEGQVASISADVLQDTPDVPPYYLARIALTPQGLRQLGPRQMQPGMPAEVVVRTGERSLLAYLLHPLSRRIAAAMKEE